MKSAIVTGANGFVGNAVAKALCESGVKVYAIVRCKKEEFNWFDSENLNVIICDMRNIQELKKIIEREHIDIFYHFAWQGTAGPQRGDYKIQLENIETSCDAVKVARELGCSRFVFAASIMEYEFKKNYEKKMPTTINNIYSVGKMSAEHMTRIVADSLGIEYVSVIISNIYGVGERSVRLLNSSIRKMLSGERTAFTAGTQMYDFIYIDDAAEAFRVIGEKGISGKKYYLGSLKPQPLKNYLEVMRDCINPNLDLGLGKIANENISLNYFEEFDIYELQRDTGFEPKISFEEGIRKTIEWMENN